MRGGGGRGTFPITDIVDEVLGFFTLHLLSEKTMSSHFRREYEIMHQYFGAHTLYDVLGLARSAGRDDICTRVYRIMRIVRSGRGSKEQTMLCKMGDVVFGNDLQKKRYDTFIARERREPLWSNEEFLVEYTLSLIHI